MHVRGHPDNRLQDSLAVPIIQTGPCDSERIPRADHRLSWSLPSTRLQSTGTRRDPKPHSPSRSWSANQTQRPYTPVSTQHMTRGATRTSKYALAPDVMYNPMYAAKQLESEGSVPDGHSDDCRSVPSPVTRPSHETPTNNGCSSRLTSTQSVRAGSQRGSSVALSPPLT